MGAHERASSDANLGLYSAAAPTTIEKAPATRRNARRSNEAALEIDPNAIRDEAVQGLLDDWLVPVIVESFIETILKRRPQ